MELRNLVGVGVADEEGFKEVVEDDSSVLSVVSARLQNLHHVFLPHGHLSPSDSDDRERERETGGFMTRKKTRFDDWRD